MKSILDNIFKFLSTYAFLAGIVTLLYFGWLRRDDNYLSAETGAGYLLGIVGGSLMILLLLYPLSKRLSLLTRLMPVHYWFRTHMLFGILGPVMILFHSNFQLGSTNSNIALISMLLVAGSGLIGRYIYKHIHHGLYGSRITLKELKLETENNHTKLIDMYDTDNALNAHLKKMEEKALLPYSNLLTTMQQIIYLAASTRRFKAEIAQLVKNNDNSSETDTPPDHKTVMHSVNLYTNALRRVAAFKLYERLFSLWHILHLPLFIMMIITAIIHVFAVHLY